MTRSRKPRDSQLPLLFAELEPHQRSRARATDPEPSHIAAANAESSGTAARHRAAIVCVLLRAKEPMTGGEIAKATGRLTNVQVMRRMDDLCQSGLVRRGGPRRCQIMGTVQTTWSASGGQ